MPSSKTVTCSRWIRAITLVFCVSLGLILFATVDCFASDTLTGSVINDNVNPVHLVISGIAQPYVGLSLELSGRTDLMDFFKRLHTGDSITARGTVNTIEKKFVIDSVDQVGLKQLLGTWRSSRWEIFEFQDFNSLNLYMPEMQNQGSVSLARTHSLKYIMTPDSENRFAIFMNDDRDVRMGFLEIGSGQLTLTINDFYTGQVSENISLSPMTAQ